MATAPIVLSTGAIARLPIQEDSQFRTRINEFADGSEQRFSDFANPKRRYRINLNLLDGSERADWMEFFNSQKGRHVSFTYVSPIDNLLKQNELFENAVYTKGSNLVIGKNYLIKAEEFDDDVAWPKAQTGTPGVPTVVADNAVDPAGGNTADTITFPSTGPGEESRITQSVFSAIPDRTDQTFTFSIWLRASSALSITIGISDDITFTSTDVSVTTTWTRFSFTKATSPSASNISPRIANSASQAGKVVETWGAQIEYGTAFSDYTQTVATATELQIADPFWRQAPAGATGAADGLNSKYSKRGRQVVVLDTTNDTLTQNLSLDPGGSGSSRDKGLQFTNSMYFKRQDVSPPTVDFNFEAATNIERFEKTVTPTASWVRESVTGRFSASNNATVLAWFLDTHSAVGTYHIFGPQLESGATVSDYRGPNTVKSGLMTARFSNDTMRAVTSSNDVYALTQLDVVELLTGT